MCGIAGVVGSADAVITEAMVAALNHRGPDQKGTAAIGSISLGTARLAIVDPAGGSQPVFNEDRSLCLVFNGEIYNHVELREQLSAKGHRFRTASDTEVIIHLYEAYGEHCVDHLRGMFSFAIASEDKLFLARDRVGIKPLYVCQVQGANVLLFSSEIKALLALPMVPVKLDEVAVMDWAILGQPAGSRTFFEGIRLLGPGEKLTVEVLNPLAALRPEKYFKLDYQRDESMTMEMAEELTLSTLTEAVELHSRTDDGKLGIVLSGGLDSTLLALLAVPGREGQVKTYTVADHPQHPDVGQARYVADFLQTDHRTLIVSSEEFLGAIPSFVATEETPSDMSDLPHFIMNREIAKDTKVCLNGEGADELFGGYMEYVDRSHKVAGFKQRMASAKSHGASLSVEAAAYVAPILDDGPYPNYLASLFEYSCADQLDRSHLHRVDKLGMAFGLENRVPFLDNKVLDLVTAMPIDHLVNRELGIRKHVLRRILIKKYGVQMLDIALREKLTFPSASGRFMVELNDLCRKYVPADFVSRHRLGAVVNNLVKLVCFDLFVEIFVEHRGNASAVGSFSEFLKRKYKQSVEAHAA